MSYKGKVLSSIIVLTISILINIIILFIGNGWNYTILPFTLLFNMYEIYYVFNLIITKKKHNKDYDNFVITKIENIVVSRITFMIIPLTIIYLILSCIFRNQKIIFFFEKWYIYFGNNWLSITTSVLLIILIIIQILIINLNKKGVVLTIGNKDYDNFDKEKINSYRKIMNWILISWYCLLFLIVIILLFSKKRIDKIRGA